MSTQYAGARVKIADLVEGQTPAMLRDHSFKDCVIVGPAVLQATQGVDFIGNEMTTTQFWTLDTGRAYEGSIGLERVSFEGCKFENVGIAADRAFIESFFG